MKDLDCIILPEDFHPGRYREIQNALGFEINMQSHPSEQEEAMKHYLRIQLSLNNLLRGTESVTEFLDKVEASDCILTG
ncbi:MAG: hypothetical protein F6K22_38755 [Okeania sp. SIO2F4]|uniref:hypothetical protein n=1 Tax=Okeania sp. SIO2F4 TaxID=2607790 RepID=UPI001428D8DE|nr:hypothetical protein [Okeania sp. SIO2F4]NES08196.1 hypothetical protein [Okeania sp. SIO2F4]